MGGSRCGLGGCGRVLGGAPGDLASVAAGGWGSSAVASVTGGGRGGAGRPPSWPRWPQGGGLVGEKVNKCQERGSPVASGASLPRGFGGCVGRATEQGSAAGNGERVLHPSATPPTLEDSSAVARQWCGGLARMFGLLVNHKRTSYRRDFVMALAGARSLR